jgi:hypothetical protein
VSPTPQALPAYTDRAAIALREDDQTLAETRATNAARFGTPAEQRADRAFAIANLPADAQARIRASDAAHDLATEARSFPADRVNFHA